MLVAGLLRLLEEEDIASLTTNHDVVKSIDVDANNSLVHRIDKQSLQAEGVVNVDGTALGSNIKVSTFLRELAVDNSTAVGIQPTHHQS